MHILWDKPCSNTPVKNGIIRHKTSAGRCRATLVLNRHLTISASKIANNGVTVFEQEMYFSIHSNMRLQVLTLEIDEHTLFLYSDFSALIAKKTGRTSFSVLPFVLHFPKKTQTNSLHTCSPIDWIEPLENPNWTRTYAQSIQEQVAQDVRFWIEKHQSLPEISFSAAPEKILPWFFPLDTANSEQKMFFQTLADGLSLIKNTGVQLIGRQINAKGILTPIQIRAGSKTDPFSSEEHQNIQNMLSNSPSRWNQIRQQWSRNDSTARLLPAALATSQSHKLSQHSALRSIALAQNILKGIIT